MLEGKLVNLRAPEMGDLERNFRWMNDPDVTQHLNMRYPISIAAEEAWMRERTTGMGAFHNVWYAIETKDGVHIGGINFHSVDPEDRKARLGVMIGEKEYWSRGYGTDALITFLRFAFDEMNLNRVDLTVNADNERARACYLKCGFVEEARLRQAVYQRGAYGDQLVMGMLRDEFYALHGASQ